uniref:Magnesium-dependent phosphatase 1 n=1 Tax=Kalanchoe fedtschenkoi TaxID=63787 RepID=A0A7N0T6L1_KALFE
MTQPGGCGNGEERVRAEALKIIDLHRILPRLVVFDLDYTLWPFYCECCYEDEMPHLCPQIDMAISSRSPTSEIAKRFLNKFGIRSIFVAKTRKREHFDKIHWTTGVPYSRMLFFNDENRNIEVVSKMGVTSIYVNNGVNLRALREGLLSFSHKCGSSGAV